MSTPSPKSNPIKRVVRQYRTHMRKHMAMTTAHIQPSSGNQVRSYQGYSVLIQFLCGPEHRIQGVLAIPS